MIFFLANGDVIVTVLPVNQKWPWITPAEFRPELVPEELMAEGLSVGFCNNILLKSSNFVHIFAANSGRLCPNHGDFSTRCSLHSL